MLEKPLIFSEEKRTPFLLRGKKDTQTQNYKILGINMEKIGEEKFFEWELDKFVKRKVKKEYRDLNLHYGIADLK